ncbi:hypothetical protein AAU61_17050 [Desulfocarbo indianensis]|nr:hypothetical protein AAU61_17050 [Desulfocarbo indianensis]
MTSQTHDRPASSQQIGYIRRLQAETGVVEGDLPQDLTNWQASCMIGELLAQKRNSEFVPGNRTNASRVNHVRLGLAMKVCFRLWTSRGHDVWHDNREAFKKRVVATYNLFTEIADSMEREIHVSPAHGK